MNPRLRMVLTRLRRWTLPGGLLVGAALLWLRLDPGSELMPRAVDGYPWLLFGVGFLLAWRFRRSRAAVALMMVAALSGGLHRMEGPAGPAGLAAARVLVPPLLAILGLLHDRPLFSRKGSAGLVLALLVLGPAWWFSGAVPEQVLDVATSPIPIRRLPWTLAPWILSAAVGGATLAVLVLLRRGPGERALLWTGVAVELALAAGPGSVAGKLHFLTAGLILTVSVVEGSYAMAFHDDLTGLPARRALEQALDRLGRTYTVAMVDVDHFKKVNDKHGHDVGDQVLRMVAARLRKASGGAKAFRYGGEEFTLLFAGTEKARATPHLEALREGIKAEPFQIRGPGRSRRGPDARGTEASGSRAISVTVSIGIAEPRGRSEPPEAVLERADKALYRAKKKGRNRLEG